MTVAACAQCGREVERPEVEAEGRWAEMLRRLPVVCDECEREEDERRQAAEREREAEAWRRRVDASGMPRPLRRLSLASLDREGPGRAEALEAAGRWARGQVQGVVLSGPVGTGKTTIAGAAAVEFCRRAQVRWAPVPALVSASLAGFGTAERDRARRVAAGTQAVVLDDFDKVNASEYALDLLFTAVDGRIAAGSPLLVTTNLRYPEIEERFGEAIASRLSTLSGHRLEGDDRRRSG